MYITQQCIFRLLRVMRSDLEVSWFHVFYFNIYAGQFLTFCKAYNTLTLMNCMSL